MQGKIILTCGHEDPIWPHGWATIQKDQTRDGRPALSYGTSCSQCFSEIVRTRPEDVFPDHGEADKWLVGAKRPAPAQDTSEVEILENVAFRGEAWWHTNGNSLRDAMEKLPISPGLKLWLGDVVVQAWTEGAITSVQEYGEEMRQIDAEFDDVWRKNMVAVKEWRAAHPGNDHVLPDMGVMLTWLLEKAGIELAPPRAGEPGE